MLFKKKQTNLKAGRKHAHFYIYKAQQSVCWTRYLLNQADHQKSKEWRRLTQAFRMAWDLEQLFWLSQTVNMAKKTLMIICNVFRVSFLNKGNYCSHWLVVSIKINIPLGKRQKTPNRGRQKREERVEYGVNSHCEWGIWGGASSADCRVTRHEGRNPEEPMASSSADRLSRIRTKYRYKSFEE